LTENGTGEDGICFFGEVGESEGGPERRSSGTPRLKATRALPSGSSKKRGWVWRSGLVLAGTHTWWTGRTGTPARTKKMTKMRNMETIRVEPGMEPKMRGAAAASASRAAGTGKASSQECFRVGGRLM
jgi:hypothetical protein